MMDKETETMLYTLGGLASIGLLISLIAWSTTWGWVWYAYLAFYSGLVMLPLSLVFTVYILEGVYK